MSIFFEGRSVFVLSSCVKASIAVIVRVMRFALDLVTRMMNAKTREKPAITMSMIMDETNVL